MLDRVKWFGENWHAPICAPEDHIPTPFGAACIYCPVPFDEKAQGIQFINGPYAHIDCLVMSVKGVRNG